MGRPKAGILTYSCTVCNTSFTTSDTVRGREKMTCSKLCASKLSYQNQLVSHSCTICGTMTIVGKSSVTGNLPVYCENCSENRYKNKCEICDIEFMAKRASVRFCSQECETKYRLQDTVQIKCDCCGTLFEQAKFNVYSGKRSYCSTKCRDKQFSLENPSRYGGTWSRWIRTIHERDNDKCLKCPSTNDLEVHHFIKVRFFPDPNDAHYDDNLGLFCKTCHDEIEDSGISSLSDFYRRYSPTS